MPVAQKVIVASFIRPAVDKASLLMRCNGWLTVWRLIVIVLIAFAVPLKADAADKFGELARTAREIVASGKFDAEEHKDEPEPAPLPKPQTLRDAVDWRVYVSSDGIAFRPPQTISWDKALWYDLGFLELDDGMKFDFSQTLDRDYEQYGRFSERDFMPEPEPAPAPPAPAPPMSQYRRRSSALRLVSHAARQDFAAPDLDVYDYPLKAQLFVELVRRFRNSPEQQKGWAAPLARIEELVRQELAAIEKYQKPTEDGYDANSLAAQEPFSLLADCDSRFVNVVLSHLGTMADSRGWTLRKNRQMGSVAAPSPPADGHNPRGGAGFNVDIQSDPEPTAVFRISGWRYNMVQKLDSQHEIPGFPDSWRLVTADNFPAGVQYVIAVWEDADGQKKWAKSKRFPAEVRKDDQVIDFFEPRPLRAVPGR